jgi:hypothetical protein
MTCVFQSLGLHRSAYHSSALSHLCHVLSRQPTQSLIQYIDQLQTTLKTHTSSESTLHPAILGLAAAIFCSYSNTDVVRAALGLLTTITNVDPVQVQIGKLFVDGVNCWMYLI